MTPGQGKAPLVSALMKSVSQLYPWCNQGNASTEESVIFVNWYLATFAPGWATNASIIIGGGTPC